MPFKPLSLIDPMILLVPHPKTEHSPLKPLPVSGPQAVVQYARIDVKSRT
jgi:hypothetical protein